MRHFIKVQTSAASQNMYPVSKCCSFLAIDYYEEMSNTFEEFLSESLLSESTCLLDEACYPLHKIDAFYRTPWHKIDFESEFIEIEAKKLNESLSSFSCKNVFLENDMNIDIEDEFQAIPLKVLSFEEKNLEDVVQELKEGHEILDVPHVPDFILQRKQKNSSILNALEKMPKLEVKEIFKELEISSVDDSNVLVDYNPLKDINILKKSEELKFEEFTTPESQCMEVDTEITLCSEANCIFNCSNSRMISEPPGDLAIKIATPDDIISENPKHSSVNFRNNSSNQGLDGITVCDDTRNKKVTFDLNQFNLEEDPETDINHEYLEPDVILRVTKDLKKSVASVSADNSGNNSICYFEKLSCSQNNNSATKKISIINSYDSACSNKLSNSQSGVLFKKSSLEERNFQTNDKKILSKHHDVSNMFEYSENSIPKISTSVSDSICDLAKFSYSQNNNAVVKEISSKDSYDVAKSTKLSSPYLEEGKFHTKSKNAMSMPCDASNLFEYSEKRKLETSTSPSMSNSICDLAEFSCSQNNNSVTKNIFNNDSYDFASGNGFSNSENDVLCNDTFLEGENIQTKNKAVLSVHNTSDLFDNSEKRKPETTTSSSLTVKVSNFLEKLSKKDFQKNVEFSVLDLENLISSTPLSCSSSTAFRDKIPKKANEFDMPKQDVSVIKKKCNKSFDFLNSYISVKNNVAMSLKPTRTQEEVKVVDDHEHKSIVIGEENLNSATHVVSSCDLFANLEDIVTELPKEFVEAFHLYERAATPVIKKLFERDQFPLPLKVTLIDISPDLTRFLLNQEVKFSRDANVNPVLGGIAGSYYIQLLTLHGILKSLYFLTHFSPKIALNCLMEYQKTHSPLLKNCYDDLKINLSNVVSELDEMYPIHPKVLRLCEFLKEKFTLCEEHMCIFKALIITNHHLSYLYTSLRTAIKKEFCNISIDLIPENIVLNQNCLNFRNKENCIYVIHSNSVSKKMPWKEATLVLEYENCNSNWRDICYENSIPHAFVKVSSSLLKLIIDFKENRTTDVVLSSSQNLKPMPLVVSEVIASNYEIMKFLNSREDVLLCERNYKRILPQMYFADVAFDEKTAAILLEKALLGDTDYMSVSYEKIIFLTLKYELIWIIVHETEVIMDGDLTVLTETQANFFQFYLEVMKLKEKSPVFKTMFLFVDSNEALTAVISDILTFRLRRANFMIDGSIFSRDPTKEEIFLASFPSLNPFVIDILLRFHCLDDLMCMTLGTLLDKYSSIPERFLSRFHHAVNMNIDTFDQLFQKSDDDEDDEEFHCSSVKSDDFEFHPKIPEVEFSEPVEEYADSAEDLSCTSLYKHSLNDFEKTLEEIDRDYFACKYSPSFDNNTNIDCSANDEEMDEVYVQPKVNRNLPSSLPFAKRIKIENKNTVVVRPMLETSKWSQSDVDTEKLDRNNHSHQDDPMEQNFLGCSPETQSSSNFLRTKANFHKNTQSINKISDIKKFMHNNSRNYQPLGMGVSFPSSVTFSRENKKLSNAVRVNKGLCSQTVSKLDIIQNAATRTKSDVETQRVSPIVFKSADYFCNSKKVAAFDDEKFKETTPKKKPKFSLDHNLLTDSDWVGQTHVRLTPFEGKRLQYEKIPGHKGQTRLVFQ